jgi:putative ABC transport system permease protein
VTLPILGVYVDYSSDSGSVLIDRSLYKKIWRDSLVDAFDLWLEPRAKPVEVVENILRLYGEPYHLFISTHGELRESVVDILEQSFTVNYAVEFVAVVVAVFSIVNTLLASVWDRAREIGVLRVMGATQRQVRAVVMVEGGFMGLIGGVLGIIAGTVMSYHHVVYNTKALTGWTFQYHYPYGLAVLAVIAAVLLSLVAGYLPAKRAARSDLAAAIAYE